jgi:orotidine-5'-phosphate decarboxylase
LLASEAKEAGVNGIVCSAQDLPMFSHKPFFSKLDFIVPGTRSSGVHKNDQARVDTPINAIINGATRLVIGRQITLNQNPITALEKLTREISLDCMRIPK